MDRQLKIRKDKGFDTHVRDVEVDRFQEKSQKTTEVISGEVLFPQPEPLFSQTAVTVKLTKGGMITGVAYPGAFIDPITGNLHGMYEGPITGQMVAVGFMDGNSSSPYIVNRFPYQGCGNSFTQMDYINPLTKKLYDSTDVLIGHFSGSTIRFNTGILSGKLPGSISVEATTSMDIVANLDVSVDALDIALTATAELKLNANIIQIKTTAQSMKTLIDSLIDAIVAIKTVGSPTNHLLDPSTITALNTEKAKWAGLLEA